jgi:hypothetical protein
MFGQEFDSPHLHLALRSLGAGGLFAKMNSFESS